MIRPPNEPTSRHFDPSHPIIQQTSAVTVRPFDSLTPLQSVQVFFVHPWFDVDFLIRDITSTLFYLPCNIMSNLLLIEMWMFCHMIFAYICDALPAV